VRQIFFQGLRENTCLLQLALKSNALGLEALNSHADPKSFQTNFELRFRGWICIYGANIMVRL